MSKASVLVTAVLPGMLLVGWPASIEAPSRVGAVAGAPHVAHARTARGTRSTARRRVLPRPWRVRAARRWAARREGRVGWAAIDTRGRLVGRHRTWSFRSASLSKAMLLVAELRRAGRAGGGVDRGTRALLAAMIQFSDNDAADAIYRRVGDNGLVDVARAARMRRFGPAGWWSEARVTPADQARFFARFDTLVRRKWRSYARRLLGGVVSWQCWGIPSALRARGWKVFFKGGWRPGDYGSLVNQAARIEAGPRRLSLAVLTDGNPSHQYGTETVRGIAARLLGGTGRAR